MLYQSLKKNRNYNGSQWLWHDNTFTVNNFFNNIKLYLNFGKLIKILNMNFLKCMIIIKLRDFHTCMYWTILSFYDFVNKCIINSIYTHNVLNTYHNLAASEVNLFAPSWFWYHFLQQLEKMELLLWEQTGHFLFPDISHCPLQHNTR